MIMAEFRQEKNTKIAQSLKSYWNTAEGKKRRESLSRRMRNPRKRKGQRRKR
jgi:hypothetical protein